MTNHRKNTGRRIFTKDQLEQWIEYSIDIKNRTLYVGSAHFDTEGREIGVDALMAEYLLKGLRVLESSSSSRLIRLWFNSEGGDVSHGMAMYDAIRDSPCPIDVEVHGSAESMGAIILQAGRKRLLHQNAIVMIHDGYFEWDGRIPQRTLEAWAEQGKLERKQMYKIFAKASHHKNPAYWERRCSHDYIMTAEKAVEEGLADEIIGYKRRKFGKK